MSEQTIDVTGVEPITREQIDRHFFGARPGSLNDTARLQVHAALDRLDVAETKVAAVRDLLGAYETEPHSDECGIGACVRCVVDEFTARIVPSTETDAVKGEIQ